MSKIIAPSLLSADFTNLQSEIQMLNQSKAEWLHLDIMDGQFVPNITFGMPVVQAMRKHTTKVLDAHLMIVQPERYIKPFKEAGADVLTVHYEACTHLHRTIQEIKQTGMKAGVSLNPHTSVSVLDDIIQDLDMVLIMSVNPGFGGQSFIDNSFRKVEKLKNIITKTYSQAIIQIDGGVDDKNIKALSQAGVDCFVAGSFVFNSDNPTQTIAKLYELANN